MPVAADLTALNNPQGISTFDSEGTFYVSDSNNRVVRRIYPNGTAVIVVGRLGVSGNTGSRVAGTAALLNTPRALTLWGSSGADVIIADSGAHALRVLYANQSLITLMGTLASPGYSGDGGLSAFNRVFYCAT
jgi:hypothetical protein